MMASLPENVCRAIAVLLALASPLLGETAHADSKVARVAYVAPDSVSTSPRTLGILRERLRELGWFEGKNVIFDEYWGEGNLQRLPKLMGDAVARKPDVLITNSTPGALAAKKATNTVPIVVAAMGDPVKAGVVSNLARPGGNITAFSTAYTEGFAGKWLELLLEAVPRASSVAVLWNLGNPVSEGFRSDLEKVANARSIKLQFVDVREAGRLEQAFQQASHAAQAAVVVCENLFIQNLEQVVDLAARYRLPTTYCWSRFARAGGLMAYGTDLQMMFRRAGDYVDKILRGANVGELPIEQASKFELVVNLKTAKALGITIPESILLRADEIIK